MTEGIRVVFLLLAMSQKTHSTRYHGTSDEFGIKTNLIFTLITVNIPLVLFAVENEDNSTHNMTSSQHKTDCYILHIKRKKKMFTSFTEGCAQL